jgi:hypothetical protein
LLARQSVRYAIHLNGFEETHRKTLQAQVKVSHYFGYLNFSYDYSPLKHMLRQQNGIKMYRILLIEDSKEIYQMVSQTVSSLAELEWAQTLKEANSLIKA